MKKKIAIFTTHPIQYQVPLFKQLAKKKNIKLTVYFASNHGIKINKDKDFNKKFAWNINLDSGYNYRFIGTFKKDVNSFFLNSQFIKKEIKDNNYDLSIIFGWNNIFYIKAIIYSFCYAKKIFLRSENNLSKKENILKKYLKSIIFYFLFKIFDKFLVIGLRNYNFYIKNGVKKKKLLNAPYSVDNNFFRKKKLNKKKIKSKLNIKNEIVFIFSGKFIKRKRPMDILKAINLIKTERNNYKFLFIGDGILKDKCISYCKKNKLKNILFLGFVNQNEIVNYYNISDVVIMPSEYETWGLSVNEAMASQCACLVSKESGCSDDLVKTSGKKKNGFIFKSGDIQNLSLKIKYLLKNKKKIRQMKKNSLEIIKSYEFKETINSIEKSLR